LHSWKEENARTTGRPPQDCTLEAMRTQVFANQREALFPSATNGLFIRSLFSLTVKLP
jgi:hypothetical protein